MWFFLGIPLALLLGAVVIGLPAALAGDKHAEPGRRRPWSVLRDWRGISLTFIAILLAIWGAIIIGEKALDSGGDPGEVPQSDRPFFIALFVGVALLTFLFLLLSRQKAPFETAILIMSFPLLIKVLGWGDDPVFSSWGFPVTGWMLGLVCLPVLSRVLALKARTFRIWLGAV